VPNGLSTLHGEYLLAQQLGLPTLRCVKGSADASREEHTEQFLEKVRSDGHHYDHFSDLEQLARQIRERLVDYLQSAYDSGPTTAQDSQSQEDQQAATDYERGCLTPLGYGQLSVSLCRELAGAAEEKSADAMADEMVLQALLSRGYLWRDPQAALYRPTIAGALLLAERPGVALPQARIQLDAYAGSVRDASPIDSEHLDEPLPRAVAQAVAFIRRNTAKPLLIHGLQRQDRGTYPPEALREAVLNAVAHRDYGEAGAKVTIEVFADRLVINSPGLPPGGQPLDLIAAGNGRSRSRNPLLVQGLTLLGFMDDRGSGVRRMRSTLEEYHLPPPAFDAEGDSVSLTFRIGAAGIPAPQPGSTAVTVDENASTDEQILALVDRLGGVSTSVCVQRLGISRDTAWQHLSGLVQSGILEVQGKGRGTKYRRPQ
jgi:predicted HTH transcriptional regulator